MKRMIGWIGCGALAASVGAQQFQEPGRHYATNGQTNIATGTMHAAGDVDGDGAPDLIVSEPAPGVRLFLNRGNGRFAKAPAADLPTTERSNAAALADVDADGDLDLILANGSTNNPPVLNQLFLNDGRGRFSEAAGQLPPHLDETTSVLAFDVDRDGDLDLVFGNRVPRTPSSVTRGQDRLYLNDGRGFFSDATPSHLPVAEESTSCLAASDVDGDGDVDLVLGAGLIVQSRNRIYLNDGTGAFREQPGLLPRTFNGIEGLAAGDIDGDRDADLILVGRQRTDVYVNDGTGRFVDETAARMPVLWQGRGGAAVLCDLDNDGDLDLSVTGNGIYANDGTGAFAMIVPDFGGGPVVAADLDLDGDDDLASGGVYLNNGRAQFLPLWPTRFASSSYDVIAELGDIDGDGDLDMATAEVYRRIGGEAHIYTNDGDGSFALQQVLPARNTLSFEFGDVDGDGDLDVVFAGRINQIYLNDGRGQFTHAPTAFPATLGSRTLSLGDVDGDGDLDAVFGSDSTDVAHLLLNDGTGTFTDVTATHFPPQTPSSLCLDMALADLDADGDLDVALAAAESQNLLFLNDGTGHFTDVTASSLPPDIDNTWSVATGDVDGDGDLDLAWGNSPTSISGRPYDTLYLNDGRGVFTDATTGRMPVTSFETIDLEFADMDADGDLDLVSAGSWREQNMLALNDGTGTFTNVTSTRLPALEEAANGVALGDVDGDRDVDIIFAGYRNYLLVNGLQHLHSTWIAAHGSAWTLEVQSNHGFATGVEVAVVMLATGRAAIPVPPYGTFGLDPWTTVAFSAVNLLPPSGAAQVSVPIPDATSLIGITLYAQALIADRTGTARLTNRASEVIW